MRLGLVHINMGPMSRPDGLVPRPSPACEYPLWPSAWLRRCCDIPAPDVTARLFDFPSEDLAAAGRVLAIVTARANAELADAELSWP